jgi:L-iditol 2-dehydrogenase
MKAAVYHGPGHVYVEDAARPSVGKGEMLIRVRVATVCATDVKTWRAGHPLVTSPVILGHEFAGIVAEVNGVPGFAPGDPVTAAPYIECGRCYLCRHGVPELCETKSYPSNGAFAEYLLVSRAFARRGVIKLPAGMPIEMGTFVEPLACVLNGLEEIRLRPREFVAVVGGGPMGLLHVLILRGHPGGLLVSEPLAERRSLAHRLGADAYEPIEARTQILERTAGRGADVVIVAVGHADVAVSSLGLARKGGRVLWFGGFAPGGSVAIDPNTIHYRQAQVHGSYGFSSKHFRRAAELLENGPDPTPFITHRLPLERIGDALELAASHRAFKVALVVD